MPANKELYATRLGRTGNPPAATSDRSEDRKAMAEKALAAS